MDVLVSVVVAPWLIGVADMPVITNRNVAQVFVSLLQQALTCPGAAVSALAIGAVAAPIASVPPTTKSATPAALSRQRVNLKVFSLCGSDEKNCYGSDKNFEVHAGRQAHYVSRPGKFPIGR
jgi:hypothetical protein